MMQQDKDVISHPLFHPYRSSLCTFVTVDDQSVGSSPNSIIYLSSKFDLHEIRHSQVSISSSVSCVEWNPKSPSNLTSGSSLIDFLNSSDNSISPTLLAVGTIAGTVSLIDWKNVDLFTDKIPEKYELCTVSNKKEKIKDRGSGSCSALSWNKLNCSQLAAGFENFKR